RSWRGTSADRSHRVGPCPVGNGLAANGSGEHAATAEPTETQPILRAGADGGDLPSRGSPPLAPSDDGDDWRSLLATPADGSPEPPLAVRGWRRGSLVSPDQSKKKRFSLWLSFKLSRQLG